MSDDNSSTQELMLAKGRIRELEQYVIQLEANCSSLIEKHNRELTVLQTQIGEMNSSLVKYRQLLEEKSNG